MLRHVDKEMMAIAGTKDKDKKCANLDKFR